MFAYLEVVEGAGGAGRQACWGVVAGGALLPAIIQSKIRIQVT